MFIVGACWPLIEKKWHLRASDVALNKATWLWLAWEGRRTEKYHTKGILISRIRGCNLRKRGQHRPMYFRLWRTHLDWPLAGLDNRCSVNLHVCNDDSEIRQSERTVCTLPVGLEGEAVLMSLCWSYLGFQYLITQLEWLIKSFCFHLSNLKTEFFFSNLCNYRIMYWWEMCMLSFCPYLLCCIYINFLCSFILFLGSLFNIWLGTTDENLPFRLTPTHSKYFLCLLVFN